jgi:hypothetical protein
MAQPAVATAWRGTFLVAFAASLSGCNLITGPSTVSIHNFAVSPTSVTPGAQATLSWDVAGAEVVQIDNGIGVVEAKGSRVIAPQWTSAYTLSAHAGSLATHAVVQVQVVPKPPSAPTPAPVTSPTPNPGPTPNPSPTPNPGQNPVARAHVGVLFVVCGGTPIPNSTNLTQIPVGCKVHLDLNLKDAHNHPTGPQGSMNWHFTNQNAFEVFETDQWSPILKSIAPGDSQVSVTVDGVRSNDLGLHAY